MARSGGGLGDNKWTLGGAGGADNGGGQRSGAGGISRPLTIWATNNSFSRSYTKYNGTDIQNSTTPANTSLSHTSWLSTLLQQLTPATPPASTHPGGTYLRDPGAGGPSTPTMLTELADGLVTGGNTLPTGGGGEGSLRPTLEESASITSTSTTTSLLGSVVTSALEATSRGLLEDPTESPATPLSGIHRSTADLLGGVSTTMENVSVSALKRRPGCNFEIRYPNKIPKK